MRQLTRLVGIELTHHSAWVCAAAWRLCGTVDRIVEVGTWRCRGAKIIRRDCPHAKLYLVDPFLPMHGEESMESLAMRACQTFQHDWNTKLLRLTSTDAALMLGGSFDLVFIDAMHTYEAVTEDIRAWLPKVRDGGVLAGHDYGGKFDGVKAAVDTELGEENIVEGPDNTWLYWKQDAETH